MTLRCWGARGSVPAPGAHTVRYGGNTSCLEVRIGEERIILDGGTGLRRLGEELAAEGRKEAVIYLTHFHWDHIQGLPFFAPAYDEDFHLRILGPEQARGGVKDLLECQMGPPYFPVDQGELPASFLCSEVEEGFWSEGSVRMRAIRVRHPSITLGYRLEWGGRSVVYVPDNELGGKGVPMPEEWEEHFEDFVRGAQVLLHDAMFTEAERPAFEGWGHSTCEEVVELALRTGVESVFFFHHAPGRTDEEIDGILRRLRAEVEKESGTLQLHAAAEGEHLFPKESHP
jgi:phosphoribosyl 1,2-cyclic phosphodiesterase